MTTRRERWLHGSVASALGGAPSSTEGGSMGRISQAGALPGGSPDGRVAAPQPIERNLGLELVRVTETAAMAAAGWQGRGDNVAADGAAGAAGMAAARWQGRGDKEAADKAAVGGMGPHLSTLEIDGVGVIGEGEKDNAPMLFNGERVGTGTGMKVDVAVDPVDGTTLT